MLNKSEQMIGVIISFLVTYLFTLYIAFGVLLEHHPEMIGVTLSTLFVFILGLFIWITRVCQRSGNSLSLTYVNLGIQRYLLALFMVFYGVPKLFGNFFDYQLLALDNPMYKASDFELAWFFYGKSNGLEFFSGIMEFVPALFLLPKRTYFLAALVLVPVTAQVFVLNFFYKIGGITLPAATILLACNLYILYTQKEKLIQSYRLLQFDFSSSVSEKMSKIIRVAKWFGFMLLFLIVFIKVRPAIFIGKTQKTYANLVGKYTLTTMKRNGMEYTPHQNSIYYKDLYIEKQDRWNALRKFNNELEPFVLNLHNDSILLYLNHGGFGDDPDMIDSVTVFKGKYKLLQDVLILDGIQLSDTLHLEYAKAKYPKSKTWFW